jgi:uncharacterized membrane protein
MIATAVATLALSGTLTAMAQDKAKMDVKCIGANECKGKGSCKSAQNDCKGKNGCKGKGFVETKSEQECATKGGRAQKG